MLTQVFFFEFCRQLWCGTLDSTWYVFLKEREKKPMTTTRERDDAKMEMKKRKREDEKRAGASSKHTRTRYYIYAWEYHSSEIFHVYDVLSSNRNVACFFFLVLRRLFLSIESFTQLTVKWLRSACTSFVISKTVSGWMIHKWNGENIFSAETAKRKICQEKCGWPWRLVGCEWARIYKIHSSKVSENDAKTENGNVHEWTVIESCGDALQACMYR